MHLRASSALTVAADENNGGLEISGADIKSHPCLGIIIQLQEMLERLEENGEGVLDLPDESMDDEPATETQLDEAESIVDSEGDQESVSRSDTVIVDQLDESQSDLSSDEEVPIEEQPEMELMDIGDIKDLISSAVGRKPESDSVEPLLKKTKSKSKKSVDVVRELYRLFSIVHLGSYRILQEQPETQQKAKISRTFFISIRGGSRTIHSQRIQPRRVGSARIL